jgi:osmotically-inducible protein OsmY
MTRFETMALVGVMAAATACGGGRMRMPATAPPDDGTVLIRVQTALANAAGVHPSEIQVDVANGVVVLKGQVHGDGEITAAVAAARKVTGVKDVRSVMTPK